MQRCRQTQRGQCRQSDVTYLELDSGKCPYKEMWRQKKEIKRAENLTFLKGFIYKILYIKPLSRTRGKRTDWYCMESETEKES